jgi:uncharacterized ion transporter superfamily protein YfcC
MATPARRAPDVLLSLLTVLAVAVALTWVLPAGEFKREKVGTRTVVVAGTYEVVESRPVPWHAFFTAPVNGFTDKDASLIIAFVLLIGGAFAVIEATGAIAAGLGTLARSADAHPGRRRWLIPGLMLAFSIGGNTFGMSEETLVFILLTVRLARRMGWDALVGVAIPFVGAGVGFAGAAFNPFTVGIAQGLSELPIFSGWQFRLVMWATLTAIAILYVMRYAAKLERDPSFSRLPVANSAGADEPAESESLALDGRRLGVLGTLVVGVVVLVVGVTRWDWYITEIAGLFLAIALAAVVIGGVGLDTAAKSFAAGARGMVLPVILIALSKSVLLVMQEGRIIDTVLHHTSALVGGLPATLSAQGMFFLQFGLNFFVPSGSGQAALTMPLMAPLSDLLSVPRQVAVLAFQLGDGLCNFVIPTSGVTMGVLAIAGIPYGTWLRWIGWLMLWLVGAGMIFLFAGTTLMKW